MQTNERVEVCIIGAGPAGLVVAMELAKAGRSVAVIESGYASHSERVQQLSDAEIVNPSTHSPMHEAVYRGLGGTSTLWGGRCVPFDPIDFQPRPYLPGSGWPITANDLAPFYAAACHYAGCDAANFTVQSCKNLNTRHKKLTPQFIEGEIMASSLERWSRTTNFWQCYRHFFVTHPKVTLYEGYTCVGLEHAHLGAAIQAARLRNSSGENKAETRLLATFFVIACGGIESTRLLLHAQRAPNGLKLPTEVPLGNYYMGHLSGKIASIKFNGKPGDTIFDFERDGMTYIRRRMTFSDQALAKYRLLNIAFWLDNPPLHNAAHKNGILSVAYLAMATPGLGRLLAPTAIRKKIIGEGVEQVFRHIANSALSLHKTLPWILRFIYSRYLRKPPIPGFFTYNDSNCYGLHYHAEQSQTYDSRVSLAEKRDQLGMFRAKVDLRFSSLEIRSVLSAHQRFDRYLQKKEIGQLEYWFPEAARYAAVVAQATDGFHQLGTTRMATSPAKGVTDPFGKVFGTSNLFVASSSVFPTSGQANPTLPLLAFAIRQAQHINDYFDRNEG